MFTEFFLDMTKPGVVPVPAAQAWACAWTRCCEVYMDNVELEEKDIFGKEGNGFTRGINDFNFERWLVGACDYGTAICALRGCLPSRQPRASPSVRPIGRFSSSTSSRSPRWPSS